jgi:hypothetical protein
MPDKNGPNLKDWIKAKKSSLYSHLESTGLAEFIAELHYLVDN